MKYPGLIPTIFNFPFTYESDLDLKVGDYVYVPFGKSKITGVVWTEFCLLYTSPSPRDNLPSRMPSSA